MSAITDRFEEAWQEYAEANGIGTFLEPFVKAVFLSAYQIGYEHANGDAKQIVSKHLCRGEAMKTNFGLVDFRAGSLFHPKPGSVVTESVRLRHCQTREGKPLLVHCIGQRTGEPRQFTIAELNLFFDLEEPKKWSPEVTQ